jgi:hypothetical protein
MHWRFFVNSSEPSSPITCEKFVDKMSDSYVVKDFNPLSSWVTCLLVSICLFVTFFMTNTEALALF